MFEPCDSLYTNALGTSSMLYSRCTLLTMSLCDLSGDWALMEIFVCNESDHLQKQNPKRLRLKANSRNAPSSEEKESSSNL